MRERESLNERVCLCVSESESARKRVRERMCVRESVFKYVCVSERERVPQLRSVFVFKGDPCLSKRERVIESERKGVCECV